MDPVAGAAIVREFLARHAAVRIVEEGRAVARMHADDGGFALNSERGALVCHFWSREANLVRRVVGVVAVEPERLRLECLRLGRSRTTRLLLEAEGEQRGASELARVEFGEAVAAAAGRDWSEWRLEGLRGGGDGPAQRLLFRRGQSRMACVAVSEAESAAGAEAAMAAGLAWCERLRSEHAESPWTAPRLVLPAAAWRTLQPRLPWLNGGVQAYRLDRSAGQLTPWSNDDGGNLDSRLRGAGGRSTSAPAAVQAALAEAQAHGLEAELRANADELCSLEVLGLEIARECRGGEGAGAALQFGCGGERTPLLESTRPMWVAWLEQLRARRSDGNPRHPLYALLPERWLECLVRRAPERLVARARPEVYSQVPVFRRAARDIVDLLGCDLEGRLLVMELKASADAAFPLQALDYWLRVRHHQQRGDLERGGYFRGVDLSPLPPRLLLVAPVLQWHPHTGDLLRWIAPTVPVERLGLHADWRRDLRVVERW